MRVIHLMGANSFTDPETSTTYEAGDDGVFELPEHVGAHYITKHAGMFRRESDHEALIAARKAEALANPTNTAPTLKALLERVTALEDKVAAWDEFFGPDAPPAPPASTPEDTGKPAEESEAAKAAPAEEPDGTEDESDDESEPAEDAPLRKPSPRKTTAKRRG